MQLSSLIGKPVLSPAGGTLGYVKSVYLAKNLNAILSLVCVDGEEEEFYLPARAVLGADDAVIAGNARLNAPTGNPCPLGKPVYTKEGAFLGTVSEVTLGEESALTVSKEGIATVFPADRLSLGDAVIVSPKCGKRTARKATAVAEETAPAPVKENDCEGRSESLCKGCELLTDKNLLGKRVKRTMCDENGRAFVSAGERITPSVIRAAAVRNRLLELSANADGE